MTRRHFLMPVRMQCVPLIDIYVSMRVVQVLMAGGSHGHNDSLSIDVWANGKSLIVDPGTYVYTGDLKQRHLFRSTAFHSTEESMARSRTPPRKPCLLVLVMKHIHESTGVAVGRT